MKSLVSLDVFDTAIFRKVFNPTDIFNLVEDVVGNNFKARRIQAQDAARKKSIFYNLVDIYKEIKPSFNPKEEIKAELLNCKPNPYILDLYNKGESDFIFISDMYLPSSVIRSMLERCGYKNPQVFVSCELGALKGSGKLFQKVEDILQRKIDTHIGDNYHADILGASRAGIETTSFIGPPIYKREVRTPLLQNVKLRKLLIDEELSSDSIEKKIGYIFSPLILAFTKKLLDEAADNQIIFFNARDCFPMYLIARWLIKFNKRIKYCRFSRKSCHFPNINVNQKIDSSYNIKAMNFFKTLRLETIKDFIDMFDLKGDYSNELQKIGIRIDSPLNFKSNKNSIVQQFVTLIQSDLYEKARAARKNFKKYITSLGMKDGDIFVDLGHFGSMQSIIRNITGIKLKGRYIHTFDSRNYFQGVQEEKTSYLPKGSLRAYTGIVEVIFSEPNGTVVTYNEEGKPILNRDTKYRKDITKELIRGVLKGARDILNEGIEIPYNDCIEVLNRFLDTPTLEEAEFGNSELFENGSYENNESVVWYNKDYIRQGKIRECYFRSYWKTAFKVLMNNDPKMKSLGEDILK